jgi:uncharacterized protein (DUF4415 family)
MKSKEIDIDEEIDFSEEAFKKRFRRIEGEELIELRARIARARGHGKNRVTIYLDGDIISKFKETAAKDKIGYQTLINDALRQLVDADNKKTESQSLKEELLKDKKFLKKLKTALAA